MPRPPKAQAAASAKDFPSSATIGFGAKRWLVPDKLRNNMDAAEYKHVVFGFIFLKYIAIWRDMLLPKLLSRELPTLLLS